MGPFGGSDAERFLRAGRLARASWSPVPVKIKATVKKQQHTTPRLSTLAVSGVFRLQHKSFVFLLSFVLNASVACFVTLEFEHNPARPHVVNKDVHCGHVMLIEPETPCAFDGTLWSSALQEIQSRVKYY